MSQRKDCLHSRASKVVRKLSAYALGGGCLAASDGHAAIVYTDLGPNGVRLSHVEFGIDFGDDSEFDFEINHVGTTITSEDGGVQSAFNSVYLRLKRAGNSAVGDRNPIALLYGDVISSELDRASGGVMAIRVLNNAGSHRNGAFVEGGQGAPQYLALAFRFPGDSQPGSHHAWVSLNAANANGYTIYGFAYETQLGKPILAGDTGETSTVGDTNADGIVDLEDLNNVRNNFGGSGPGDADDDNDVDLDDLNAVRNNFGAGGATSVPEPPSLLLLASGAAGLAMLRRRRMNREKCELKGKT